ncbi:hypothetical protein DFJ74DRAFT_660001, partial [Hyaloraphidium curvatum]
WLAETGTRGTSLMALRPRRRGAQNPSDHGDSARVMLLPEIFLVIFELLEATWQKRTLLSMLSACRGMLMLGIGVLVRRIEVPGAPPSVEQARALDRFRGLLSDSLGTGKLGRVEDLSVTIEWCDAFFADLVRGAGGSLKKLEIVSSSRLGVQGFLEAIDAAGSLERVRLKVKRDSDPGVPDRDPQSDPFLPLLRHLDGLNSLKEIHLDDCKVGWRPVVQNSCSWPASFFSLPTAGSRLRSVTVHESRLHEWEVLRLTSITAVAFRYTRGPATAGDMQRVCDAFPGLRALTFAYADTETLAGIRFGQLEELILDGSILNLDPGRFPEVKSAIEASGVRVRIRPSWYIMQDLLDDSEDAADAVAEARRWLAEETFWRGVRGAEVEGFGKWDILVDEIVREGQDE